MTPVRRILGLSLVTAFAVGFATAPPAAGNFEAKNLRACVGYTFQDLAAAPLGTELPFGGVRVFAKDHQRGRSKTYCVTVDYAVYHCCHGGAKVRLPEGLRRNAKSLRLATANACRIDVEMLVGRHPRKYFETGITSSFPEEAHFREVDIPETLDDRARSFYAFLGCFDATT